jgi:hypothetical protein
MHTILENFGLFDVGRSGGAGEDRAGQIIGEILCVQE